jgi:hypothetical protein
MEKTRWYTLYELANYANWNFPEAYAIISDTNSYKFERRRLEWKKEMYEDEEVLHIGYKHRGVYEVPIYAHMKEGKVWYCYGTAKEHLRYIGKLSTDAGPSDIPRLEGPLRYLPWSNYDDDPQCVDVCYRERERLMFAVRFVHLLTGRITDIAKPQGVDILKLFKEVCVFMEAGKKEEEGELAGPAPMEEVEQPSAASQMSITNGEQAPAARNEEGGSGEVGAQVTDHPNLVGLCNLFEDFAINSSQSNYDATWAQIGNLAQLLQQQKASEQNEAEKALKKEVQDLQIKLAAQKMSLFAVKRELAEEKKRLEGIEKQKDEYKEKYTALLLHLQQDAMEE